MGNPTQFLVHKVEQFRQGSINRCFREECHPSSLANWSKGGYLKRMKNLIIREIGPGIISPFLGACAFHFETRASEIFYTHGVGDCIRPKGVNKLSMDGRRRELLHPENQAQGSLIHLAYCTGLRYTVAYDGMFGDELSHCSTASEANPIIEYDIVFPLLLHAWYGMNA
jgi:hypothetical protein